MGHGMFSSDDLVLEKLDLLLAEVALLHTVGPHFRIVHRFRKPGVPCGPGEEIACVHLMHRSREHVVPLSLTLRILSITWRRTVIGLRMFHKLRRASQRIPFTGNMAQTPVRARSFRGA